ncbi:sensor histidine kinase [Pseudomonas tussilaginis]|uniref:sensor histidine kinase n=1 Tax=Pseudomonas sp. 5 TaxID=1619949 RepID=UPI0005EAD2F6|nr:PAS domain-containing sensor histidine kinase [Pseudomonas sp. 5]KJK08395.1 histidine kinase [Pseudomonas sp. 5]
MLSHNEPDPAAELPSGDAVQGLLLTAENGCIERANLTFCRWMGYSQQTLLGMRIQELMSLEARTFHQAYWQPLMQLQGGVANVKFDLMHHDGYKIPMMLSAISCARSNGVFHELALFKTEDRRKYERGLVNARLLAEGHLAKNLKAQRSREIAQGKLRTVYAAAEDRALFAEQMIGIVSHDLRNPLSAIRMAAEILLRRDPDARTIQMLGHISHSVERAQRLVADLLDFTLVQVGRGITVERMPLSFHDVVADCLEEIRLSFPKSDLVHLRSGEGEFYADSDRLYQLVGNLVANAIAYGAERSTVTVSTHIEDNTVTLSVHNLGTPIPAALLSNLFEPMIRGSHDNAELRSVGLGLFIVREIVSAHQGHITVCSTAALGTQFIATFPLSGR